MCGYFGGMCAPKRAALSSACCGRAPSDNRPRYARTTMGPAHLACTGPTTRTRYLETFLSQDCAAFSALDLPPYEASPKKARCFGRHDPSRVR